MWDATRFAIGIILVVVLPMVALGGVPWTVPVFIALIGFEMASAETSSTDRGKSGAVSRR